MPSVGPAELIVVLVIALVFLGPKRLPDAGRSLGNGLREFKDAISGSKPDLDTSHINAASTQAAPAAVPAPAAAAAPVSTEKPAV